MYTVQHVARTMPSSRAPVAPTPGSGNQVVNIVEDSTAIAAQLSTTPKSRFYPLSGAGTTLDMVDGSTPGIISRYEQALRDDVRYRLDKENMAFQYLGSDGEINPFPTTDVLANADADRRLGGRTSSRDTADNHMPAQTTLAGMPDLAPHLGHTQADYEVKRRLLMSRMRLLGKVTSVDSGESQNGRTVAHVAGPQDVRWLDGHSDGRPGDLIQWIPLTPDEIPQAAIPGDEASETHHMNPHLVPRVVSWKNHDLGYKGVFDDLVSGIGPGTHPTLRSIVAAAADKKQELKSEVFANQYQKAWYHLLLGAAGVIEGKDVDFDDFHTRLAARLTALSGFTAKQWQSSVSRMLLAMREISLAHDASIHGRLCYYSEKKEQNLYIPLSIGNY